MIAKIDKFPMRTDFVRFRATAKRFVSPHASCFLQKTTRSSHLSVVVPAKVNKKAVVRNWLKRLVYDRVWPELSGAKRDCVIIFKPLPLSKSLKSKNELLLELDLFLQNTK